MIQDLRKRMEAKIEKMQEMFNKDLEELKNKQTERNNAITETKTTLEGINSRINEVEDQISEEEIGNLPEKQLRLMIVKMTQDLRNRMETQIEKIQEMFNKELEDLKNEQR